MRKRTPALDTTQLDFSFAPPEPSVAEGALADLERVIASAVGGVLRDDPRSRYEVAGEVSALLADDVTKLMLDAYASEARDGHNVSMARFLALVVATRRYDVLDAIVRRIGCGVLVGEDIHLAEIGHLESQKRFIDRRLKTLKSVAEPLRGARR